MREIPRVYVEADPLILSEAVEWTERLARIVHIDKATTGHLGYRWRIWILPLYGQTWPEGTKGPALITMEVGNNPDARTATKKATLHLPKPEVKHEEQWHSDRNGDLQGRQNRPVAEAQQRIPGPQVGEGQGEEVRLPGQSPALSADAEAVDDILAELKRRGWETPHEALKDAIDAYFDRATYSGRASFPVRWKLPADLDAVENGQVVQLMASVKTILVSRDGTPRMKTIAQIKGLEGPVVEIEID